MEREIDAKTPLLSISLPIIGQYTKKLENGLKGQYHDDFHYVIGPVFMFSEVKFIS